DVLMNRVLREAYGKLSNAPAGRQELEREYGRVKNTPALKREVLVSLRDEEPAYVKSWIWDLARAYDGHDRFYLAAIGIAVGTDPKRREVILADFDKHFPEWNDKVADLVWELRPPSVMPTLGKRLMDAAIPAAQRARIVDILATSGEKNAGESLLGVL